jgi:hypothetical protein
MRSKDALALSIGAAPEKVVNTVNLFAILQYMKNYNNIILHVILRFEISRKPMARRDINIEI